MQRAGRGAGTLRGPSERWGGPACGGPRSSDAAWGAELGEAGAEVSYLSERVRGAGGKGREGEGDRKGAYGPCKGGHIQIPCHAPSLQSGQYQG
jgi:hypothetical protein